MINQVSFNRLVDEIMGKGFDEETAAHFAALIGDAPTTDKDGNILVIEAGKIVATLKLGFFQNEPS